MPDLLAFALAVLAGLLFFRFLMWLEE